MTSKKREQIRNYFTKRKPSPSEIMFEEMLTRFAIFFILGSFLITFILVFTNSGAISIFLILLIFGVSLLKLKKFYFSKELIFTTRYADIPEEQTVDAWLIDDIEDLKERSIRRLNINKAELIRDSIVIRGPILWSTNGIPSQDLLWKKGKDQHIRFSINTITVIHLTDYGISSYQCDFNLLKGVPLNERDDEFHYRDVVAVSTRDDSTNYRLPNNVLIRHAQLFKLSVSSGDSIQVVINSSELLKFTGGTILDTGLDSAIRTLRKVLSQKKS
jgi:hypothetical protein